MLDPEEFSAFVVKAHPKLLSFASKNLHKNGSQDAPDVVQAALTQVWAHRAKDITNLRQYVYLAVLQACLYRNRSIKRYLQFFKSDDAAMRLKVCHRSDIVTRVQITEILRQMPIAARARWSEALVEGRSRIDSQGVDSVALKGRVAREKKRLKEIWLQVPNTRLRAQIS